MTQPLEMFSITALLDFKRSMLLLTNLPSTNTEESLCLFQDGMQEIMIESLFSKNVKVFGTLEWGYNPY